jgi:hypothetical protein
VLATELDALVTAHPAMVEAYERGMVRSGRAGQVAEDVQQRLVSGGLTEQQAREAYVAVHALVLGFALVRAVREPTAPLESGLLPRLVDKLLDGLAP